MSSMCACRFTNETILPSTKIGRMKQMSLTWVPIRYGSLTIRMSPCLRFSGPYSTTAVRTASVIVPTNSTSELDIAGIE